MTLTTKRIALFVGGFLIGASIFALTGTVTTSAETNTQSTIDVTKPVVPVTSTSTPVPTTTKQKVQRLDVELEQILILDTEVTFTSVELLISEIQARSSLNKELYLVLDSPGGSVFDGARLISYMEASKVKINTVVYGLCASMCAQIFEHGHKRYMVDRGTLMFHSASGGLRGTVPSMKSLLNYIDREVQKLDAYVADRAGIPRDKFANMVIQDLWISADDAVNLKLADALAVISLEEKDEEAFTMSEEFLKRNITNPTIIKETNPLREIF